MHLIRHDWTRLARNAWRNRQELVQAGQATRRDLLKLGLLTAAGTLVAKHGLSSRVFASEVSSPPTRAFVEPLPIPPVKRPLANGAKDLVPFPTVAPNNAGGEGRTRAHQAFTRFPATFAFPPALAYEVRQREARVFVSPDLPEQRLWGFDGGVPGPTYHARYGEDLLIRNRNELPADNGGFGAPQVSTHLHNGHAPSESDGFPGDFFPDPTRRAIARATFYDQHYPNVLAGFSGAHAPGGDRNESLATLWYHDHRVGFTAQNTYKGLAGFYLLFNELDAGDETRGFRLPGVRDPDDFYAPVQYDVPLFLGDRLFDPSSGRLFFDLFGADGILGDKFLVNGKIQPYFEVAPRRYRFRILNGGPSRYYQLFLTDHGANTSIPVWQVSNDGNLLPRPLKVKGLALAVAQRVDVVIDFRPWAGRTLYLENRLRQQDGRGPDKNLDEPGALVAPGKGARILQFRVGKTPVRDDSVDFEAHPGVRFYDLPPREAPRIVRRFRLQRKNGQWAINDNLFPDDASVVHFRVRRDAAEHWLLSNDSGGWMHPGHIHFEEFQFVLRNGRAVRPDDVDYARKDMVRGEHGSADTLFFRFRDWEGRYPFHCHNVLHEDHAMMLRFDVDETGDQRREP
jgi:FtsP/CotA-like multicopper oxidase with cupredoxin domain